MGVTKINMNATKKKKIQKTIPGFRSMKISTLVHVCKTLKDLETPISDFNFRKKHFPVFHKLVHVSFLEQFHVFNKVIRPPMIKEQFIYRLQAQADHLPNVQTQSIECHFP